MDAGRLLKIEMGGEDMFGAVTTEVVDILLETTSCWAAVIGSGWLGRRGIAEATDLGTLEADEMTVRAVEIGTG